MATPQEVQSLIYKYRATPQLFDDTQLDELEKLAEQYNITFKPKRNNTSLGKIMKQVTSGLFEGFTTIPVGEKPKTTYESIAHSMGHLIGFAPGIVYAPLRGIGMGAKALKLGRTASVFESAAKGSQVLNKMSVPMLGGKVAQNVQNSIFRKSGLESLGYLRRGGAARGIVDQAQHLGAASAVSSVWQGPDVWLDAYMGGAIAGGAFGTLGEMKLVGKQLASTNPKYYKIGEQSLKSIIGGTMMGLPAYLRDEPIENIMYETLLGGYFGYNSRPSAQAVGGKFISDLMYGESRNAIFKPEDVAGWKYLHKDAKKYVLKSSAEQAYYTYYKQMESLGYNSSQVDARVYRSAQKKYRTESPTDEQIKITLRELANDYYTGKTGYVYAEAEVYDESLEGINRIDAKDQVETSNVNRSNKNTKLDEVKASQKKKPVYVFHKNKNSDVVETSPHNDSIGGKKVGDKYVDRPVDYLEGEGNYGYLEKVANHEVLETDPFGITTVKGTIKDHSPFAYKITKEGIVNEMTDKDWWNLENNLDNKDMYIFGGVKDKGILTLRKHHQDVNTVTIEALIKSLVDPNLTPKEQDALFKRIKKNYLDSLNEYLKIVGEKTSNKDVMALHEKQYKSNILSEAQRNGMYELGSGDLSKMHILMKKGFSKNVIDWTKREQLYHDKSMPLPKGTIDRKLNFVVVNDIIKDIDGKEIKEEYINAKGEKQDYVSNTDGTLVVKGSIFDKIMKGLGLPEGVSMNKPVIVAKIPGYGTIAIKSAGRRARKNSKLGIFMGNNGVDMVMFKSAAKHTGTIEPVDIVWNKNTQSYELPKNNEGLQLFKLNPKDIRINLSTYENPNVATKGMFLPRQMLGNLSLIKHGNAAERMWKEHYETAINGSEEVNNKVLEVLSKKDIKDIDIKDIDVNEIGTETIIKIFREAPDSPLARKIARQMARMDKDGELESYSDLNTSEYEQYIFRNNRILDNANFNEGSREAQRLGKKYWQDTYKKYMINRYIRPKYKQSTKAWLSPVYAHEMGDIKQGTFKLDRGQGKMRVKDINGKDTTLAEAYKKGTLDLDSFVLIRVPADSPSGVRVLKFGGFTNDKGYSVKTHAKDDMYLGGADKDSDSVFIFQGMHKDVLKAFKKSEKQWEKNGKMSEAKDKKYDKDFGAEKDERFENPESKFSPSFRRTVAQGIYRGQQNLGPGLTSKQAMSNLADMVHKSGGRLKFTYIDPKTKKQKELFLEVGDPEALDIYGREIVNRSADAADNPNMIDFLRMPQLLWEKGKFKVRDANGALVPMTYSQIKKNSSLGRIHRIFTEMNPKAQINGRNKTLSEWTRDIERNIIDQETGELIGEEHGVQNLFNLAAQKMHSTGFLEPQVNHLYKYIETGNQLVSRINRLAKSDSELDFIKNEISKIASIGMFGKPINRALKALAENNFRPVYYKGGKKDGQVKYSVEKLNEMIDKEVLQIASYNVLSKKAMDIYRILKEQGVENPHKVVEELLLPIQEVINDLKFRKINERFKGGEELTKSIDKELDAEIMSLKESGWKRGDKDVPSLYSVEKANGLRRGILSEYFDLYMLSPFMAQPGAQTTAAGIKKSGQRKKLREIAFDKTGKYTSEQKRQANLMLYPSYEMHAARWQSQSISDRAIKEVTKEFNELYQFMKDPDTQTRVEEFPLFTGSKQAAEQIKPAEGFVNLLNNQKVNNIADTAISNTKKTKASESKPKESLEQSLRRKAITEQDFAEIELFKRKLKENPKLAENFNDFFTMFTMGTDRTMIPRDVSTLNLNDIYNINRYLKDYDRRYKKRGLSLKPAHWYMDPRTISEHHALIEGKVFSSYEMPVLTSDGVVKRKVKMFTSTQGELQETFSTLRQHIDKNIAKVQTENLSKYDFRNTTTPKEQNDLNDMMIDYIEGKNYKLNKLYSKYKNKKFKADNREMTTDEMVEFYGERYKKDLKEMGDKYIYAKDKSGKQIEFSEIDKDNKYGTYNEFLRWDKKTGKFDFAYYLNNAMPDSLTIKRVPIENSYRFHYEMIIEKIITKKGLTGAEAKAKRESLRKGKYSSFKKHEVGKIDQYFPHLNFGATKASRAEIEAWLGMKLESVFNESIQKGMTEKQALKEVSKAKAEMELFIENSSSVSGLGEKAAIDGMMHNTIDVKELNNIGVFSRPESLETRIGNMPGWDRSPAAIDIYKERLINSVYKSVAVSKTQLLLDKFKKDKNFGEHTGAWADFLSIYVRDAFGHNSTFPQRIQEAMERGQDPIAAKNTLYRGFSDTQAIKAYKALKKRLGSWMPYSNKVPDNPYDVSKEPKKWAEAERARNDAISKIVHNLGAIEARYNLITLLSTPKVMVGNLFGATQMSFNQSGFLPYKQAMDFKHVEKTLLKDRDGNYVLTRTDSSGNKVFVKTKKDLKKWLVEEGIIDSYIQGELQYNQKLSEAIANKGETGKQFVRELTQLLRTNPDARPLTIVELGKKYGIDKKILNASGFFMQVSERKARYDAFLSTVIKYRNSYGRHGADLNLSDPALVKAGMKGIEASQFLYHTAFRAPFMRTATGKVMTRFKHFVFQSVRARKEFYRQAKHYGFKEGTEPYEKFKRMFVTDMMTTALGVLFAYSLFDTSTPPPYDFFASLSDLVFGDKKERDRAFFGTLPRPVAPLQYGLPPIARVPINVITPLINDDWDKFWDYNVHTMYPFGRLIRSVDKTIDEPYGTTFGRFTQQFAGIPTDKIKRKLDRNTLLKERKRTIDETLDSSYNIN
tara:strand:+ start:14684 stop:22885 length:8202 start_codon:yes stop_codon:yes gene_type:complete